MTAEACQSPENQDVDSNLPTPKPSAPQEPAEDCALHASDEHIDTPSGNVDNSVQPSAFDTQKAIEDLPGKPARRFTRSSLKPVAENAIVGRDKLAASNTEAQIAPDSSGRDQEGGMWQLQYPTRRITRSLAKAASKDVVIRGGSMEMEPAECAPNGGDSSLMRTTSKKKMELKMSKNMALTKVPSNVRQLLATGLMDGMRVVYITHSLKDGLQGVIRNGGILCSCSLCRGAKNISAYHFELHAGSARKNPAEFICLENGKSMLDILKCCIGAPMDMLVTTIQNAIKLAPSMQPVTCKKCKGQFSGLLYAPRSVKFQMLCDSCLESVRLQSAPRPSVRRTPARSVPPKIVSRKILGSKNNTPSNTTTYGKLTKKDIRLHRLVFTGNVLPSGTEVGYYVRGKRLLEGYIKDIGIFCRCCNCVITPSQFEAHAGRASRKKPYNNIYTSNGVSLHELSVSLSKGRKLSMSENDDLCSICADGGKVLVCDLCPRVFHVECVGLSKIPKGDWYCQYCENLHQRDKCLEYNDNAMAAGRVAGVDPIEQIFKRCIRIVETQETDSGGCVLCRSKIYGKSKFGPHTVLLCGQCEREYHIGCLKDHNMGDLKEMPKGEWFCCSDCNRIHAALQDFCLHGPEIPQIPNMDSLRKNCEEKGLNLDSNVDLKWRLLCGKSSASEFKLLLSKAVSIFHECFDPIVESVTGRDLIPPMVYGRNLRYQDYGGMYCAILTLDSAVVSACIVRVLGIEIAELPLAATHRESQGKGYFKILFSCIESSLRSLGVKHFVLPAADEVESIWTKKFGFSRITKEELQEYSKGAFLTTFCGTSMLHKALGVG